MTTRLRPAKAETLFLRTWFTRLAVFVVVLLVLDRFFAWNVSILGSLVATLLVYLVMQAFDRGDRPVE